MHIPGGTGRTWSVWSSTGREKASAALVPKARQEAAHKSEYASERSFGSMRTPKSLAVSPHNELPARELLVRSSAPSVSYENETHLQNNKGLARPLLQFRGSAAC
jgi:hypothetical protein